MKFSVGLAIGFGLGVAVGLMLAPQSGEEIRDRIGEQGIMLRERSSGLTHELRARASDAVSQGKEIYQKTKNEMGSMYSRAKSGEL